jgi:starch phosphorylase
VQYREAQAAAGALYDDPAAWARKALLTVSRMGRFSSDRTIQEYADEIWRLRPVL